MVRNEVNGTVAKAAGGAATYAATYTTVDATITVAQASEYAALAAGICTALYFLVQFLYTCWKWYVEIKKQRNRRKIINDRRPRGNFKLP